MKKITKYGMGLLAWLNTLACFAVEKFEILPDLPEPILPRVEASTVSGGLSSSILGTQSVGHEPSIISVVLSLLFVVLLIYMTGIIYAKLNKVGFNTLKRQQGELAKSRVSVVSTTALGGNKTLHVVELDGKRMLIGASAGAIQLLKDLGSVDSDSEEDYSHIEIPNIKIPKIEIPKIEIPTIGFSKIMTKAHKAFDEIIEEKNEGNVKTEANAENPQNTDNQENPDGLIDSLFTQPVEEPIKPQEEETKTKHIVDPEEFSLYKKYLG